MIDKQNVSFQVQDKKDKVRRAIDENQYIDSDLKNDALELQVNIDKFVNPTNKDV